MQALEGIKVIDLTRILSGPFCTMMLADFGAEVIKIESPSGDDTRSWGPPFIEGESAYFLSVNRNKKSIVLNLKKQEGIETFFKLAENADVVVENFKPGTIDKLGIGFDQLKKVNSRIILASISGFGQTGPLSNKPGYDVIAQGMGGIMSVTGELGRPPVKVGFSIADIGAGMWAAYGIMVALWSREKTGEGQKVDASLLDTIVSWHTYVAGNYFASNKVPEPMGGAHPNIVPYQVFSASDGYFNLAVGNDSLWGKFCDALDLVNIKNHPKFVTNSKRVENREELVAYLQDIFKKKTVQEWINVLNALGVPCGPIYNIKQVYEDPHILDRDMLLELEHPVAGNIKMTGIPLKLSFTPGQIKTPPPTLGEHTNEILKKLGIAK